jgi:hypothetical protein
MEEKGRIRELNVRRGLLLLCLALSGCTSDPSPVQVPAGDWGGKNADLVVTESGATAQFKCGDTGQVAVPLRLDPSGGFAVSGTYDPNLVQGGPRPASYTGRLSGSQLQLTIQVEGSARGPFTLVRGQAASFDVCNF